MKVLLAIDSLMGGGKERQFVELVKGLALKPGITAEILIFHPDIHYGEIRDLGIPVRIMRRNWKYDVRVFWKVMKYLADYRPDIVHSWNTMVSCYLLPLKILFGYRFVEGSIRSAPSGEVIPKYDYRVIRFSSLFAEAVVANSRSGLRSFRIGKKGTAIYNGFDIQRINRLMEATQENDSVDGSPLIGMVGNFTENKDYETYFRAAELIREKHPGARFAAIGDGPHYQHFRDHYGNRPGYWLPGRQKDIEKIVSRFDICVLCSTEYGEGISNAILEYHALKKPVVVLDCPGNREVVEQGKSGLFYSLRDPVSLAQQVELLLHDKQLGNRLGEAGYSVLTTKFSLQGMVNAYQDLYFRILRKPRG